VRDRLLVRVPGINFDAITLWVHDLKGSELGSGFELDIFKFFRPFVQFGHVINLEADVQYVWPIYRFSLLKRDKHPVASDNVLVGREAKRLGIPIRKLVRVS